jgi:TPR repeat protein
LCALVTCGAALNAGTLSGLCAGCRAVRFCGADCQRAGWPAHRAACKAAAAQRTASAGAAAPPASSTPGAAPTAALKAQYAEVETWARMPLDTLRKAAEDGDSAAQAALGRACMEGTHGVSLREESDAYATTWLRKAASGGLLPPRLLLAQLGLPAAHAALGTASAPQRYAEVLEWARPVAEAGDAGAQGLAHICCLRALDHCKDSAAAAAFRVEAVRWGRLAAAQGDIPSVETLARYLWDGAPYLGLARDRPEAERLFAVADAAAITVIQQARFSRPAGAPGSALKM